MLGERFVGMFAYIADRMTSCDFVTDAMTLLVHLITLLRRKKVCLPPIGRDTVVRKHHTEDDWHRIACDMKNMFDKAAATFYIDKKEDMKELIDTLVAPILDMSWKCPVPVPVSLFFGQNPYFPGHRFRPNNR